MLHIPALWYFGTSVTYPMASHSQISCNTPTFCIAAIFVKYCYTTGSPLGEKLMWNRSIHRSPVNSPHKDQWRGALMFSLICVWINGWVNNREAGDLRRYRAHYDVTVMESFCTETMSWIPGDLKTTAVEVLKPCVLRSIAGIVLTVLDK